MKRVLKFKRTNGNYLSNGVWLCGIVTQEYFDVDESFDLHISDKKPRGDNYYTLRTTSGPDYFRQPQFIDATASPTLGYSARNFIDSLNRKTLYVWVMA